MFDIKTPDYPILQILVASTDRPLEDDSWDTVYTVPHQGFDDGDVLMFMKAVNPGRTTALWLYEGPPYERVNPKTGKTEMLFSPFDSQYARKVRDAIIIDEGPCEMEKMELLSEAFARGGMTAYNDQLEMFKG